MQLVINISKKKYNEIKERTIITHGETFAKDLVRRIRNGTPLPEHHGRLIDEKELSNHLKECLFETALNNMGYKIECHKVFEDIADNRIDIWIKDAPAIIEGSDA